MVDNIKTQKGFTARRPPVSYPLTEQQLLVKEAAEKCGVHKGMSRGELLDAMKNCLPRFYSQRREGEMSKEPIKVFHSPSCEPCHEVTDLLDKGRFETNVGEDVGVELVDVSSADGFKEVADSEVDSVPSAKYNGKTCKISIDREEQVVVLDCEEPVQPEAKE